MAGENNKCQCKTKKTQNRKKSKPKAVTSKATVVSVLQQGRIMYHF